MVRLTHSKFVNIREQFYRAVLESPFEVEISKVVHTKDSSVESFMGADTPTITSYVMPALHNVNAEFFDRDRFGLGEHSNGVIYVSPLQLEDTFGSFILDCSQFKVKHIQTANKFAIRSVKYVEPLFDSCIAVELTLMDIIRQ